MEKKIQKIYLKDYNLLRAQDLSNLVNNLSEEIYKIECKCGYDNEKFGTFGI